VMAVDVMVVDEAADPMTIEDSADPGLTRSLVRRSPSQSPSPSRKPFLRTPPLMRLQ
jgi:hypothetical protein